MTSPSKGAQAYADDRAHVFHSWSAQAALDPLCVAGGEGAWIWDYDDNRFLDFSSQLVFTNLGHQHPKVVAAIQEQAATLCTLAPQHAAASRGEAARLLAERAPGDINKVFFTNGGAEANENAIRMARLVTGRHKVLASYRSYHGATHAAITLTGEPRRWPSEPSASGVVHFNGPYTYRSSFGSTNEAEEAARALGHLREIVTYEGPHTVAAIVLETIVGTNGILVPPDGYLAGVRALCDEFGIYMIADEVMTGFGRTGTWFGVDHWGVVPDLISCAKGINSGYVPLGAVLMGPRTADHFAERPYPGGLTYSGHPLACAAAVAAIKAYEDDGVIAHAAHLGNDVFAPRLAEMAERHPAVGDVRGKGCFWGVELVRDRTTREMLVPFNAAGPQMGPVAQMVAAAKAQGLLMFCHWNVLILVPPLVATDADVEHGLDIIDEVLKIADEAVV